MPGQSTSVRRLFDTQESSPYRLVPFETEAALSAVIGLEYINQGSIVGRVTPVASWYCSSGEQIRASDR